MTNRLFLFDIDGTLLSPCQAHAEALTESVSQTYGIDISLDEIDYKGSTDWQIVMDLCRVAGLGRSEALVRIEECRDYCVQIFEEYVNSSHISLIPGAKEGLDAARASGAYCGLVTGNFETIAWKKMEMAGLRDYFCCGGFGSDSPLRAQLPSMALQRLKAAKLAMPEKIIIIGDTLRDIKAAKEARLPCVAVATGLCDFEELTAAAPWKVINNLSEMDWLNV